MNLEKNIASHLAAAVAVVGAVLAAVHPGFTLPSDTQTVATAVLTFSAGVIESINTFFHRSNAAKLSVIKALADKAVDDIAKKESTATAATLP